MVDLAPPLGVFGVAPPVGVVDLVPPVVDLVDPLVTHPHVVVTMVRPK